MLFILFSFITFFLQIIGFLILHLPHMYFSYFKQIWLIILPLQNLIWQFFRSHESVVIFVIVFAVPSCPSCCSSRYSVASFSPPAIKILASKFFLLSFLYIISKHLFPAKFKILKNTCKGHLRNFYFTLYFLAISSVTSSPNFVLF